jgi:hypothetical protein
VRLDEGLAQLESAIELDPGFAAAHPMIAIDERLADLTFQRCNPRMSANRKLSNFAAAKNSLDSFRPLPFGSVPEYSSTPQRRRRRLGCNVDVCNETIAKRALMSGSFAGLRTGLTASVFTTRRLSAQSSNTLMKMLRGAP